jgi:hypothetical protein
MGLAVISCCGKVIYENHNTSGNQGGIIRCPDCGCLYSWKDIGNSQIKYDILQSCPFHSFNLNLQNGKNG